MDANDALMSPFGFKLVKYTRTKDGWVRWWIEGDIEVERYVVQREEVGSGVRVLSWTGHDISEAITALLNDYTDFLTESQK